MATITRQSGVRRGFTLIEAVAAITILGILGSITSQLVYRASQSYCEAATRAQLHAELSTAIDRIDKELRQISIKSPYATVAPNIDTITASSIAWQDSGGAGQRSFSFSGGSVGLYEQSTGLTATLATSVTSFVVQGYDEANAAMAASLSGAACDGVRRLSVTVTATRSGITESLRTKVYLRCAMDGAAP